MLNTRMLSTLISRHLNRSYDRLGLSTNHISSGLRVQTAVDDTSVLSARELMRSDIAVFQQGVRNSNDAISLIQVADGALAVIDEKLIRLKELATQAATGTYNSTQRGLIGQEFRAIAAEIERIANATDFNGIKLLDGTLSKIPESIGDPASGILKIHFGDGNRAPEDYASIGIPPANLEGLNLVLKPLNTEVPHIDDRLTKGVWQNEASGNVSFAVISKGTTNLEFEINDLGRNDDIQLFTRSGEHLIGTQLTGIHTPAQVLTEANGFPPEALANYTDAQRNGNGQDIAFDGTLHPVQLKGMNIGYTGNGNPGNNAERLTVDRVTEDIIVVVTGEGRFDVRATWENEAVFVETQQAAGKAIERIDQAIRIKDNIRVKLGALQTRMEDVIDRQNQASEEYMAQETRMSDIDVADEMTVFTTQQIRSQMATAMLAQANTLPSKALELLR